MDSDDDIDPQTADVAALKEYVDERIESVRQSQERQWLNALKAAGFDRETIENSVDRIASHGMTRRAALGVVAASVFGAGVFTGQASAAPGDDGDTVWGSDTNRSDWYADEIDANLVTATESQYKVVNNRVVNGASSYFSTAQDAIDFADANDYPTVQLPGGIYGAITIPENTKVIGSGGAGSNTTDFQGDPAVTMSGNNAQLENAFANSTGTVTIKVDDIGFSWYVYHCHLQNGVMDIAPTNRARHGVVHGNWFYGSDITLGPDSDNNVIDSNSNVGTITDNGTNNIIGDNS